MSSSVDVLERRVALGKEKRPVPSATWRSMKSLVCAVIMSMGMGDMSVAAASDDDGLYGRWDESLVFSVGLSGAATHVNGRWGASLLADARMWVGNMAGPVVSLRWGPDTEEHVFFGVAMRPLFPGVFLEELGTWRRFPDLVLQSLFVEMGAALVFDEQGPMEDRGRVYAAFAWGGGVDIPLVPPERWAQGVWLRAAFRHVVIRDDDFNAPNTRTSEWTMYMGVVVAWGTHGIAAWEPSTYHATAR